MAITYEPIATTTLGSAQTSITFSSIPSTYTDLIVVVSGTSSAGFGLALRFNSDTGNNYSNTFLYGDGSSALSGRGTSENVGFVGYFSTGQSDTTAHIMNYANTTTYKTTLGRGNQAGVLTVARAMLYRSTSAINNVQLYFNGTVTFGSGTTATLYGIKAA